ncbi:hypothetical protein UlMin_030708 [Ulmus minor]
MDYSPLPSNLLFEILTRTSLETLGRCRLVCKKFNQTTREESFIQPFYEKTKTITGFFVQHLKKNKHSSRFISTTKIAIDFELSLSFLPKPLSIVATTQKGLLLCVNEKTMIPKYLVCKPTTQEWRFIPNRKTKYFTKAIAIAVIGSKPLRYKIVRFSDPKTPSIVTKFGCYTSLRAEIFDSKTWRWKQLSENIKFPYDYYLLKSMATISGVFYSLMTNNNISVFDLQEESWEFFELPCSLHEQSNIQLVEYEGRLGLICLLNNESMELWVMKNYKEKTWSRRKKFSIKSLIKHEVDGVDPIAMCNNDVTLMKNYWKFIFYNFQNGSNREVKMETILGGVIFKVESDFEPANLNNPQKLNYY